MTPEEILNAQATLVKPIDAKGVDALKEKRTSLGSPIEVGDKVLFAWLMKNVREAEKKADVELLVIKQSEASHYNQYAVVTQKGAVPMLRE